MAKQFNDRFYRLWKLKDWENDAFERTLDDVEKQAINVIEDFLIYVIITTNVGEST